MADDPLSRFTSRVRPNRTEAFGPPSPPVAGDPRPRQDGREAYEPFDAKDRAHAHGFDLRCTSRAGALSYVVMYNYLHSLAYDRRTWTRIFITVSGLAIEVRGRNLRAVVESLRTRTCSFVQEFSPDEHILPEPVDPSAPFIESISVEVIGGSSPDLRANGDV